MELRSTFRTVIAAAALTAGLAGCIYVPPPPTVIGPRRPPPGVVYGEPIVDPFFAGDMGLPGYRPHRRGRTQYLREYDPDYVPPERDPAEMTPDPDDSEPDAGSQPTPGPGSSTPAPQPTPPPEPKTKVDPSSVPAATKSSTPGRVKSPYPPYRELDVSGMASGSLAKDPTTGKVFRVP